MEDFVPKRKSTSEIWKYFGYRKDDTEQKKALCRQCLAVVASTRGNTSNMFDHLKRHHKLLYDQCKQRTPGETSSDQKTITETFASLTPYDRKSKRHQQITDAITFHLAKDMAPMNTVVKTGFKKMICTLDKRYEIPSRTYFSQVAIPELYEKQRLQVANELLQAVHYAFTADLWSSRTTAPYIGLTIHFINDEFELKSRCLQTAFFPDVHTSENIAAALKEAVASWNLDEEHLVCITSDNAANIVRAASLNKWTRLQCFGHRLHLAVECQTRWGSRQMMISRILEQQRALAQVLSKDKKTRHLIPTWQDIDVLESVSKSLGPLLDFTDALSGEDYISISCLKPVLHLFNTQLLQGQDEETDLTKKLKKEMLDYTNEKCEDKASRYCILFGPPVQDGFHRCRQKASSQG
ncbi:E3 SUMO-protein ligase ZBED1-like isoform X1 [Corythoichthys intestinalis]|uniref:E3 SUMO-protein ligase ZBED1-like isoform X1 n=1 Tax=Corythoichthys intestinalis TaxID=161448 RepID=UPI0025A4F851|nr:E3 SUMO-protein ligase ZBED1-like isoform X1 [Corythoichthys intestinalis]